MLNLNQILSSLLASPSRKRDENAEMRHLEAKAHQMYLEAIQFIRNRQKARRLQSLEQLSALDQEIGLVDISAPELPDNSQVIDIEPTEE
jgi:hypothetical protein